MGMTKFWDRDTIWEVRLLLSMALLGWSNEDIQKVVADPYMTTEQVAKYLQLDPVTIRRHTARGLLPAAYIGGQWRYRKEEVDAAIARWSVHQRNYISERRMQRWEQKRKVKKVLREQARLEAEQERRDAELYGDEEE
jgi:excisionase family DNA binding protein